MNSRLSTLKGSSPQERLNNLIIMLEIWEVIPKEKILCNEIINEKQTVAVFVQDPVSLERLVHSTGLQVLPNHSIMELGHCITVYIGS